jgi:translation initiation factor 1 (eIF-1/SUI1)
MNNEIIDFINNPLLEQEKQISAINKKISIKYKARNMKKGLTTVYGLHLFDFTNKEMETLASIIKKKQGCAAYVKEIEGNCVIEIQGNKTIEIKNILINQFNISNTKISLL